MFACKKFKVFCFGVMLCLCGCSVSSEKELVGNAKSVDTLCFNKSKKIKDSFTIDKSLKDITPAGRDRIYNSGLPTSQTQSGSVTPIDVPIKHFFFKTDPNAKFFDKMEKTHRKYEKAFRD